MNASFRIERLGGGSPSRFALHGVVDENADLSLFAELSGHVVLDLKGIRRVNSFGVRVWITELRRLPAGVTLELSGVPPAMVDQINMIAAFAGPARVVSFYAGMMCDGCEHEETRLFDAAECRRLGGKLPETACPRCGAPLALADLEDQYLLFLRLPEPAAR